LNTALNFYDSVFGIIDKLSDFSEIGAVAYESEKAKDKNIRQLIVKNHRIIYMIENDTVYILTILSARLGPAENLEK
jgi:plasmid stabilization system protein ParE